MTSRFKAIKETAEFRAALGAVEAAQVVSRDAAEVVDDATADAAAEVLVAVGKARKAANEQRRLANAPIRDRQAEIKTAFDELLSPLDAAERALKDQLIGYRRQQEHAAAAEKRRLEANARKRQEREDARAAKEGREPEQHQAPAIKEPPKTRQVAGGSVSVKKVWKLEVVKPGDVPREYLKVDDGALRAAVREGAREIPGVRIWQEETAAVR